MAFLLPLAEGLAEAGAAEGAAGAAAGGAAEAGAGAAEGGVVEGAGEEAAGGQTHNLNPAQFMQQDGGVHRSKMQGFFGPRVDLPPNTAYEDPGHTS